MKKVEIYITSCNECPHADRELGMHEKTDIFCELMGVTVHSLDKDDDGIPIICPLDDSVPTQRG